MASIPDITDTEKWIVHTAPKERYRQNKGVQLADSEIWLHAAGRDLTSCPVIYWQADDRNDTFSCHLRRLRAAEDSRDRYGVRPWAGIRTGAANGLAMAFAVSLGAMWFIAET